MHIPKTKIRFFSSADLKKALSKEKGVLLWDGGVPEHLGRHDWKSLFYPVPGGEQVKRWKYLDQCLSFLAENSVERSARFVALGGGASLDLGAFAASLYRRGMPLILIPSTLLGAVDAAIGGKTAVDYERAKNFAGTFYFADEVWIAPHLFETLSVRERRSGAGEMWKTLWIAGDKTDHKSILEFVKSGKIDSSFLRLLKKSIQTKNEIVKRDPYDQMRVREILNFGHTVGHALEALAKGKLNHGESVLWGMAIESGFFKGGQEMEHTVKSILLDLQMKLPELTLDRNTWIQVLLADKKMKAGFLEFTVLTSPGKMKKMKMKPNVMAELILNFLEFYQREGKRLLM